MIVDYSNSVILLSDMSDIIGWHDNNIKCNSITNNSNSTSNVVIQIVIVIIIGGFSKSKGGANDAMLGGARSGRSQRGVSEKSKIY